MKFFSGLWDVFAPASALWIGLWLGTRDGFKDGQQDALEGKWSFQRVVTEDGAVKYIQLDKPVIRKAETKP